MATAAFLNGHPVEEITSFFIFQKFPADFQQIFSFLISDSVENGWPNTEDGDEDSRGRRIRPNQSLATPFPSGVVPVPLLQEEKEKTHQRAVQSFLAVPTSAIADWTNPHAKQ
ncbi:MAG: hypothetical protein GY696_04090 [Gammaproteobacteria bacterium]|nr:hypothetical protein [Gammaproteobacteria bacterium]